MKIPDMTIYESVESVRGCGYRKAGGLYLVSGDVLLHACPLLPLPLAVCQICGSGIKQFRGFGWVNARALFGEGLKCSTLGCVLTPAPEKAGLIWVGEKFYSSPAVFAEEAFTLGVSRRIRSVPRGLVPGETVVLLAHPQVPFASIHGPGIFSAFVPEAIEYVVAKDDPKEKLQSIAERGIRLVRVLRDIDSQMEMFPETEEIACSN